MWQRVTIIGIISGVIEDGAKRVVYTNSPGNLGSILGHVIPKTLKMVLDTSLINTQQYKVRIKGKVEQSRERSSALPYSVEAIEKGAFWSLSTTLAKFTFYLYCFWFTHSLM